MKKNTHMQNNRGAISIGAITMLFALILSGAVIGGYFLLTRTQRLERALEASEQSKKADAIESNKREREMLRTIAKSKQETTLNDLKWTETVFTDVLHLLPGVKADAEKLRTGDEGRKLALREPLLRQAEYFFEYTLKDVPADDHLRTQVENIRRLQVQLENASAKEEAYVPDEKLRSEVEQLALAGRDARRSLDEIKIRIEALKQEARVIQPVKDAKIPLSLAEAISRSRQAEASRIEQENAGKVAAARTEADRQRSEVSANEIRSAAAIEALRREAEISRQKELADQAVKDQQAQMEADRLGKETDRVKLMSDAEWADNLKMAATPAIQGKLSMILQPGYWQPGENTPRGMKKEGMSLSKLQAFGALTPTDAGLRKLATVLTHRGNDRAHLPKAFNGSAWARNEQLRTMLIDMQQTLIKYGKALVEMGAMPQ